MDVKKKILIKGKKVHDVGYRLFLLDEAEARLIPYLNAKNIKNEIEVVEVLVGGEKEQVESFAGFVETDFPEDAEVDSISVEEYEGNIKTIESFSRSFSISQLSKIARTGVAMLNIQKDMNNTINKISESQDKMLEKQDKMLEKQDMHIKITEDGFNDMRTGFGEIKEGMAKGFGEVKEEMTKGFGEVKEEIRMLRDDFRELFMHEVSELRSEIAEIKATLARMQAAG
jgi:acylphosphatase